MLRPYRAQLSSCLVKGIFLRSAHRIASHRIASHRRRASHLGHTLGSPMMARFVWKGGGGERGARGWKREPAHSCLPGCPALPCTAQNGSRERGKLTLPWMLGESRGKTDEKGEWEWEVA
ncbi:hypothetical protein CPAR01_10783 [Colletotrichum paranaense]|uniref:Uncharacterized protein n=1 Tax=Colletotrichum paranaense TaxID=1914294 RepID=A0ABQ9S9R8_9PEZI|nr:uncharacterized protein CPAR01_10783 [Colletotrichum paranaense]KAK1531134.1 hypothetical protein CPAR01_10783 [Colletotrichum paranaense]